MIIYLAYFTGIIGTWMVADGVASLWTYVVKDDETFWRNHALRILRSLLGLALIGIGVLLLNGL